MSKGMRGGTSATKTTMMVTFAVLAGLASACSSEAVGDGGTGQGKGLLAGLGNDVPQGTTKDGTASNGGSTTTTGGTTPTTPSSGKSCYSSGSATCDACVNAKCCTPVGACAANSQCTGLNQCLEQNMCEGDPACQDYCAQRYPGGVSLFNAAAQCVRSTCGGSCSG